MLKVTQLTLSLQFGFKSFFSPIRYVRKIRTTGLSAREGE